MANMYVGWSSFSLKKAATLCKVAFTMVQPFGLDAITYMSDLPSIIRFRSFSVVLSSARTRSSEKRKEIESMNAKSKKRKRKKRKEKKLGSVDHSINFLDISMPAIQL